MIEPFRQILRWHFQPDLQRQLQDLRETIHYRASSAINSHGFFAIVLAGGSTPKALYQSLVTLDTDWSRWHIYFSDERCLPIGDSDRNDTMTKQVWLDHVAIPKGNIHAIPAEKFTQGAVEYSTLLEPVIEFDLVLLGLGEDGHTASLFPDDETGFCVNAEAALFVKHSPKPPSQRITLSAKRLSLAREVWFLVFGESKRTMLNVWREGQSIPAARILPKNGIDIFTDQPFD